MFKVVYSIDWVNYVLMHAPFGTATVTTTVNNFLLRPAYFNHGKWFSKSFLKFIYIE